MGKQAEEGRPQEEQKCQQDLELLGFLEKWRGDSSLGATR